MMMMMTMMMVMMTKYLWQDLTEPIDGEPAHRLLFASVLVLSGHLHHRHHHHHRDYHHLHYHYHYHHNHPTHRASIGRLN